VKAPLSWEAIVAGAMPLAEGPARDSSRGPGYELRVLSFMLGREEYAIDILRIREIIRLRLITDVPRAPPFVQGIISLRGTVIAVVDLRKRLRLPAPPPTKRARILIVHRDEELFGLLVDEVRNVVPLKGEEIEATPAVISSAQADFLSGIGRPSASLAPGGSMMILVALDSVLSFTVGGAR
jgi:purine-binding chemotaxis protein CheW